VITLIVSPNENVFNVHESKLSSKAEYFKVALAGNWQEANNGVFILQEENASVFNLFVHWLYYDVILPISFDPDAEDLLIEAYSLGDRRGSEEFKNCVLSRLQIVWTRSAIGVGVLPSSKAILLAFSEETQSPNLRKLIADKHAWEGKHDTLLQQATATDDLVHPGFVLAVYIAFLKRISTVNVTVLEAKCKATHTVSGTPVKDQKHDFDLYDCTKCRNVGCVETKPKAVDTKVLRSDKEAPYVLGFCAHYHEHSKSAKCRPAFSSCKLAQSEHVNYFADIFLVAANPFATVSPLRGFGART